MKIGACIDHGFKGDGKGYARIIHIENGVRIREGRHVKVLRDSLGLSRESVKGYMVRHKCDNPRCINPEHLELGTAKDNMRDKIKRGRNKAGIPLGESSGRCRLSDKDVELIRTSYVRGSREFGSVALARKYNVTHSQILYIVKGLSRIQGTGIKEYSNV